MPGPGAVAPPSGRSLAEVATGLRELRLAAGQPSYAEIARRIGQDRAARGVPEHERRPARNTVYDCFRTDRRRVDIDLVVEIVRALGAGDVDAERWAAACRVAQHRADAATLVEVTDDPPLPTADFVGRQADLASLTAAPTTAWICGMPGVGKSQLAWRVVHELIGRGEVRGAVVVDLRGYSQDAPADPDAAQAAVLRLLGVPQRRQPTSREDRTAQIGELLAAEARVLVLDDALDADQVRPLLPPGDHSWVLATARTRPTGLDVPVLPLDVLSMPESLALLARTVGDDRVAAEPALARDLADLAGRLPLALHLTASRIEARPGWQLADHLSSARARHDALRLEEAVAEALDLSYETLGDDARAMLRTLALHPLDGIEHAHALVMAGRDVTDPEAAIAELAGHHLLTQVAPSRYGMHALVRVHAQERSTEEDPPTWRRSVRDRLADHLLDLAWSGMIGRAVALERAPLAPPHGREPQPVDAERAQQLLAEVTEPLLALAHRGPEAIDDARLVETGQTLSAWLYNTGRPRESVALQRRALAAARSREDLGGTVHAHTALGLALVALGETVEAVPHLHAALKQAAGFPNPAASAANALGVIAQREGDLQSAEQHLLAGLDHAEAADDDLMRASILSNLAGNHRLAGRLPECRTAIEAAIEISRAMGDTASTAHGLANLAELLVLLDEPEQAETTAREALALAEQNDFAQARVIAHANLGESWLVRGRHDEAAEQFESALQLCRDAGDPRLESEMLGNLARCHLGLGDPTRALRDAREAIRVANAVDDGYERARALAVVGDVHRLEGDEEAARAAWQDALGTFDRLGAPEAASVRDRLQPVVARAD